MTQENKKKTPNITAKNYLTRGRNISIFNSERWMNCPQSTRLVENSSMPHECEIIGCRHMRAVVIDSLKTYFMTGQKPPLLKLSSERMTDDQKMVAYTFSCCLDATEEAIEKTAMLFGIDKNTSPEFNLPVILPDIDSGIVGLIDALIRVPEEELGVALLYSPWSDGVFQSGIWTDMTQIFLPKLKLASLALMREDSRINSVIYQIIRPYASKIEHMVATFSFDKEELEDWLKAEVLPAYRKCKEKSTQARPGLHCVHCLHTNSCDSFLDFIENGTDEEAKLLKARQNLEKEFNEQIKEQMSEK